MPTYTCEFCKKVFNQKNKYHYSICFLTFNDYGNVACPEKIGKCCNSYNRYISLPPWAQNKRLI